MSEPQFMLIVSIVIPIIDGAMFMAMVGAMSLIAIATLIVMCRTTPIHINTHITLSLLIKTRSLITMR